MVKSRSCIPNVTAWLSNVISTPICLDNFVDNCLTIDMLLPIQPFIYIHTKKFGVFILSYLVAI